jgi:mono/diheme cytochrome c family protein
VSVTLGPARVGVVVLVAGLAAVPLQRVWGQGAGTLTVETPPLAAAEAAALKNPIPFSNASIAAGKQLYVFHNCSACHGTDGKALVDVVANATDLTSPNLYDHGTKEGEIFKSIRDGAASAMPPYKGKITKDADIWNLVNFVQSLWPDDKQPKKQ